jgi:hypothetical protein
LNNSRLSGLAKLEIAKAAHHRNLQNILLALKTKHQEQLPFKTPEQISDDEDYKVPPTSANKIVSGVTNNNVRKKYRGE